MEDAAFVEEFEDRYFNRLRERARETGDDEGDMERGGRDRSFFSPDYFNAIWEGRGG